MNGAIWEFPNIRRPRKGRPIYGNKHFHVPPFWEQWGVGATYLHSADEHIRETLKVKDFVLVPCEPWTKLLVYRD